MVYEELDKGAVLDTQIGERCQPTAIIGRVAICVDVRNIASSPCSVEEGLVRRQNHSGARIPGTPLDQDEACGHVVHMEDDVGEPRVSQEMSVDVREGCVELQLHDGLKNPNLGVLFVRGHPRFRGSAVGKERKAAQTSSSGPSSRICKDVDRGSGNMFLCEEDCDAQLLHHEKRRPPAAG